MARRVRFCLCLLATLLLAPACSRAQAPAADVALVLVTDVSRSIDDTEFALEKHGYAAAFTDARTVAAIRSGPAGRIAVAYVEFSGSEQVRTVIDWTIVADEASAAAFAARLMDEPRTSSGRTAIGAGLQAGMRLLAASPFGDARQVIDVAGDGTSNAGPDVAEIRDKAVTAGITVNGLAIINDHPVSYTFAHVQPPGGLGNYYRENVTGGPGSFVVEVHDFGAFGQAMARKLISEIAARPLPTHG